jgi:hypothetical protein
MAARFMKHFLLELCIHLPLLYLFFDQTLDKCSSSNQVYNFTSSGNAIKHRSSLIINQVTPLNTPRTGLISSSTNSLTYRLFTGVLTNSYFCNAITPTTPTISQEWNAVTGISGQNWYYRGPTTTSGPNTFKHCAKK